MDAPSRLTFSSALDESRSRRLLRRHRVHLPHPARKSRRPQTPTNSLEETTSQPGTPPMAVPTIAPATPLDQVSLTVEPD